ncbi:TonB-dependent receptor plug domain-containing protein [Pontibacter qinzhouensis]|uniref:TonB-dependent receptor plug domain-containing protein n=1 Tax=Pontibacter qinzhouensis TaxID=2603253 RepID=A0A5C8J051_9BACT|nr:TonB-dependent receptor [Pontibacter qinzhouensis]TXK26422.1 TonB-dependent receptor plug domain-containing protein [Pontibacter qinzhouensis]
MLRDLSACIVKYFTLRGVLFLMAFCCLAQVAKAQQDTSFYQLKAVEVFGKPAEVFAAGSRVSSLDSSYLRTYTSATLAEALQTRTPLYLKTYGASGISSVSFRGTSASHTAVLWNGLNIAMPSLGQNDFATLPLSGIGQVAVQHGAAGAHYGNGAIGGAVLLQSPEQAGKGIGAEVQQEVGSFGRYYSNAALRYSNNKLTVGASGYWQEAQNNFTYRDLGRFGAPETRQEQARVQQKGITQDLKWQFAPKSYLAFRSWYTYTHRQLQPAMGAAANKAEQLDKNLRLMAEFGHTSRIGETTVKAGYFTDFLHYTDVSNNSVTDITTYQLQAEQTYTYGQSWSLRAGLNLQHFAADVRGYGGEVTEDRAAAFLLFRYDPDPKLALSLNLRQAFVKGYNPSPTPTLGASWQFVSIGEHLLYLKGNVSGSYRVPTLNERFWRPGGNPLLKPEQGWQAESGLRHTYSKGNLTLESEFTGFYMLVDNWVLWTESEFGYWTPLNLQKVRSQGLEWSSRATTVAGEFRPGLSLGYALTSTQQVAAYEGTSAELNKQLPYVPLHKVTVATDAAWRSWTFTGNLIYNSERFTNNNNSSSMPGFTLLGLALGRQFRFGPGNLHCTLRADNVTNTEYQTMVNRAMPPRNYTLNLRFIIP